MSIIDKAHTLSEALPYIRRYHKKTVVIKYGGGAMQTNELCRSVIGDIVLLNLVGISVVMVHGGGPEINEMLGRVGKESKFINGLRYTDKETMEIAQMVLCGKVSKQMTQMISEQGGRAISLSGIDGKLFTACKHSDELGFVGEITKVNPEPVELALKGDYIPVVSSIAGGESTGESYNINADSAASALAVALGAEKLILLTDVRGLLRDPSDENTLISTVELSEVDALIDEKIISGGFIPKVKCCVDAVSQGVPRAHILDGRMPHSILIEMLSDQGIGTMFLK